MAKTITGTQSGTGKVLVLDSIGSVALSEIIAPYPHYYEGSTIRIEERLDINITVGDLGKIDADLGWWQTKYFLGTYQLIGSEGTPDNTGDNAGYLSYQRMTWRRQHEFTLVGDPGTPIALGEQFTIQDCNFQIYSGVVTLETGEQVYQLFKHQDVFRGAITSTAVEVQELAIIPKIRGFGLFLRPGTTGVEYRWTFTEVDTPFVSLEPAAIASCFYAAMPSCFDEFTAWKIIQNADFLAGLKDRPNVATSGDECLGGAYETAVYNCADGGSVSYVACIFE